MKKNGILTLLFAFIPGAGQMYQGYMKRGLSLVLMAAAISMAAMLIPPIAFALLVVFMYSFFDTFNLRAQISMGTAPEDDYLVHFDPQDKRLARMMMDSHKLVGWCLIAIGALIAYEQIIMNTLGDILWRWGQKNGVEDLKKARWYIDKLVKENEVVEDKTQAEEKQFFMTAAHYNLNMWRDSGDVDYLYKAIAYIKAQIGVEEKEA